MVARQYIPNDNLATKPIGSLMQKQTLPLVAALLAISVGKISEVVYVGYGVGISAMAGLMIILPITTLINAFGALVSAGGSIVSARMLAPSRKDVASSVFGTVLMANIVMGVVMTIAIYFFGDLLLNFLGASATALPYAREYLNIVLLGYVFEFSARGMMAQLQVLGRAAVSMRARLISAIIQVAIVPVLIFWQGMGVTGVAVVGVFSQAVSCVYMGLACYKYGIFTFKSLRIDTAIIKAVIAAGNTPFLTNACGCAIAFVINIQIVAVGQGSCDLYLAAYAIVYRITQLLIQMVSGVGRGYQTITNFNLSIMRFDRVREALMKAVMYATLIMVVGYSVVLIFAPQIVAIFTNEVSMVDFAVPAMRIAMCTFPFVGSQMIALLFFQAVKMPKLSMFISLTRQLVILLPLLLFLPKIVGINGIWWAMSLADVVSVSASWFFLWVETKKLCK